MSFHSLRGPLKQGFIPFTSEENKTLVVAEAPTQNSVV